MLKVIIILIALISLSACNSSAAEPIVPNWFELDTIQPSEPQWLSPGESKTIRTKIGEVQIRNESEYNETSQMVGDIDVEMITSVIDQNYDLYHNPMMPPFTFDIRFNASANGIEHASGGTGLNSISWSDMHDGLRGITSVTEVNHFTLAISCGWSSDGYTIYSSRSQIDLRPMQVGVDITAQQACSQVVYNEMLHMMWSMWSLNSEVEFNNHTLNEETFSVFFARHLAFKQKLNVVR